MAMERIKLHENKKFVTVEHEGSKIDFSLKPYTGNFYEVKEKIERDWLRVPTLQEIVSLMSAAPEVIEELNGSRIFGYSALRYFTGGKKHGDGEFVYIQDDASNITPRSKNCKRGNFLRYNPEARELKYGRGGKHPVQHYITDNVWDKEQAFLEDLLEETAHEKIRNFAKKQTHYKSILANSAIINNLYTESGSIYIPLLEVGTGVIRGEKTHVGWGIYDEGELYDVKQLEVYLAELDPNGDFYSRIKCKPLKTPVSFGVRPENQ